MSYCMLLFHCCSWVWLFCLPIYEHGLGRIVCSKFGNLELPERCSFTVLALVSLASAVMLMLDGRGSIPFYRSCIIPNLVSKI